MSVSVDEVMRNLTAERRQRISRLAAEFEQEEREYVTVGVASRGRFVVYLDADAAFRFRLVGSDGVVVVDSQAYASKEAAEAAICELRRYAVEAETIIAA